MQKLSFFSKAVEASGKWTIKHNSHGKIGPFVDKVLAVVEQKVVQFYGDEIIAIKTQDSAVYVPVRPTCDLLGVDWSSQRQRIARDPALAEESNPCVVVIQPRMVNPINDENSNIITNLRPP